MVSFSTPRKLMRVLCGLRWSKAQHHKKTDEGIISIYWETNIIICFSLNGTVIQTKISCKLLGVHLDGNLSFSKHVIISWCKKTSRQIANINRFKKLLSTTTKLLLSKAYIYWTSLCLLLYCMHALWQNSSCQI